MSKFTNKCDKGLDSLGILTVTIDQAPDSPDGESKESYFSWESCDICGTTLGGDRYDCSAYNEITQDIITGLEVCSDCIIYIYNGEDPTDDN